MTGNPSASWDVARIEMLLREGGFTAYEPRVVGQLLDVAYATTRNILTASRNIAYHCGKPQITEHDVQLALDFTKVYLNESVARERTLQMAKERNAQPLPPIRHNFGLKLPNDRFCLLNANVEWTGGAHTDAAPQKEAMAPPPSMPVRQEVRPEHIVNSLKRPAPSDDYD